MRNHLFTYVENEYSPKSSKVDEISNMAYVERLVMMPIVGRWTPGQGS